MSNEYSGISFKKKFLNDILDPIVQEKGWGRKGYMKHAAIMYDLITQDEELDRAFRLVSKMQEEKQITDQELREMMQQVIKEEKEDKS